MSRFMDRFTQTLPQVRVRFGAGVRNELAAEIEALGARRALLLSTPTQADLVQEFSDRIGPLSAGIYTKAEMHTPVDVSEDATSHAFKVGADCVVAIGGGSTIGLGKAIAWRTDLPQIVVPTTYAGSEATPILGQTEEGRKATLTDRKVQPEVILYDPELVATLPVRMTITSAMNAMAHAAEGLYARDRGPLTTMMAVEGLTAFRDALPAVIRDPSDISARGTTLYGAWLCGTVLGTVGMALHHKLCHTLGGTFNLPHAETHAIVLPHAIAYNTPAVPEQLQIIADLFGGNTPGIALHRFAVKMGAPTALRNLGLQDTDLERAVEIATQNPYWNPRPVEPGLLRDMLQRAWEGTEPLG